MTAAEQLGLEPRWYERRLCAFDLETTGPLPEEARIVSACIVHVGAREPTSARSWLVNPGVPIPAEATAIHGITDALAAAAMPAVRALVEIVDELARAVDAGEPIVVYNAPYDLTVLDRELRRHQVDRPIGPARVIDPLCLDKHADRMRRGSRKLTAVCEHYRARLDGAHDASHDAIAAARVAYRIGQLYPAIGRMGLDELHEAQQTWHAIERRRFAAYRRERGEPLDDERTDWPLLPWRGE